MKKKITIYGISLLIALAIILVVCGVNGVFTSVKSPQDVVKYVCDGCFVSAILFLGIAGLSWASKEGTFDGIGFTVSRWKNSLFHNRRDWKNDETYSEYKERKDEARKKKKRNHLLYVGLAFAVFAVVFYIVYKFAFN